jgi:hypothetical protein
MLKNTVSILGIEQEGKIRTYAAYTDDQVSMDARGSVVHAKLISQMDSSISSR